MLKFENFWKCIPEMHISSHAKKCAIAQNYISWQKSCLQTPSNQFNVLNPPSKKARTQISYGLSYTKKNRVQPEKWLIWKAHRCHFLMHWYEVFNLYTSSTDTDWVHEVTHRLWPNPTQPIHSMDGPGLDQLWTISFQVRLRSNRRRPTSVNSDRCKFPILGTVYTSGFYLMLFSEVGQCRYRWKWIGRSRKHCHSRWGHLKIVLCRKVITTSGICPPSWNFWVKEASCEIGIYTSKNRATPPPKKV